jgi:hypothetical protein
MSANQIDTLIAAAATLIALALLIGSAAGWQFGPL